MRQLENGSGRCGKKRKGKIAMNKVILMGRIVRDPDVRYSSGEKPTAVARYTLAVDRKFKRDGEQTADFISCVAFGKQGQFAENYLHQGMKIVITGRIQTGSYTNRDGKKVYTTDVVVEEHEFAESKSANENPGALYDAPKRASNVDSDGFMQIPEGLEDTLPFS